MQVSLLMRKYSNDKNIHLLVHRLIALGWRYHQGKKHGAIISPTGKKMTIPSTPSDYRAFYNFRSDIRRQTKGDKAEYV